MEDNSQPSELLDRYTQAGTERKRARRACKSCHAQKARCSGTMPKCLRCSQRGFVCEYASKRSSRRSPQQDILASGLVTPRSSVDHSENSYHGSGLDGYRDDGDIPRSERFQNDGTDIGCDKSLVKSYIDAYFDYVGSAPGNGFIHKAIFLRSWACGTINQALLKAVCGSSARFLSADASTRRRAQRWINEAETYIWQNLSKPSTANLQVLTVVLFERSAANDTLKSHALMAVASKMAYMLQINHENEALPTATRECRRRLMWSLFYIDKILAGGFPEMIMCPAESMHIQLPASLRNFELEIAGPTGKLRPGPDDRDEIANMGIKSFFMRLADVRSRILLYTRRIIIGNRNPYESREELSVLQEELEKIRLSLPETMSWSERNLFLRAYSPQLTSYVMLHALWHQLHCDLYRFASPGIRDYVYPGHKGKWPISDSQEEVKYGEKCRQTALDYAIKVIEIFRLVLKIGYQASVTDFFVTVIIYHCVWVITRSRAMGLLNDEAGAQFLRKLPEVMGIMDSLSKTNPVIEDITKDIALVLERVKTNPQQVPNSPEDSYQKTTIPFILSQIRKVNSDHADDIILDRQVTSPQESASTATPRITDHEHDSRSTNGHGEDMWTQQDMWLGDMDSAMSMSPLGVMFDPFWTMQEELGQDMMT